jgi:aminoglycoside phosphotransferase (APT) family kinase protein
MTLHDFVPQDVLRESVGGDWTVIPTLRGAMGSSFLATSGDRRLFLKMPADLRAVPRLAEIGIAPPVVAAGEWRGRPFLVQEWITAESPDRPWLRAHAPAVVALMRAYHTDAPLRDALLPTCPGTFAAHLARELGGIESALSTATAPEFHQSPVRPAIRRLFARARDLPGGPLVPTHGDPNPANLLIAPGRIYLVDWDAVTLSDPLRDLSLYLWWFLPPAEWPAALHAYDGGARPIELQTIEWWAARASLRVALWLDAHHKDSVLVRSFLTDFLAAESGGPNPKMAPGTAH